MGRIGIIFVLCLLTSCGFYYFKIAVDGQDYQNLAITPDQAKSIFRETKDLPDQTQLAIALIDGSQITFYGIRRMNDTIVTFDNHQSIFEIGSISKVFTATLLADFAVHQNLQLDHSISSYLKWPIHKEEYFTFKQLANHTSGLPRMPSNWSIFKADLQNPYEYYDTSELKEYVSQKLQLKTAPGETFAYSNLGACLLGFTLTQIDQTTYENLLQNRIFQKYDMQQSTSKRNQVREQLVLGQKASGKVASNWDLNIMAPAGGILSSVSDLSKFVTAQFDESDEVLKLTRTVTYSSYQNGEAFNVGLGWMIRQKEENTWFWHNGGTGGYASSLLLDVDNQRAVIILSNVSGISRKRINIESLCERLMHTL